MKMKERWQMFIISQKTDMFLPTIDGAPFVTTQTSFDMLIS